MQLQKNIKLLTYFNFFTDFKLYAPIAIVYFAQVTGSYALGMSIFSITMISSALFEVPTGIYSDFIGRKKTVILGAASAVIYAIFYAIGGSYLILIAGAIFEGLSRAFYSGNNNALLLDSLKQSGKIDEYDEFLGRVSSMFQIALTLSAILGSFLASWSFSLIMWISVISQIICLGISLFLIEPRSHTEARGNIYDHLKQSLSHFRKNKKLRMLSIASIIGYGLGEASYQFQSAFYSVLWPLWAIGLAKTFSNLGASVSFMFSGKIIKRFNALPLLVASNTYSRIMGIISTLFPTFLSPLLLSSTSLFFGVSTVAENTLLQKEFKNEQRATMDSLNSLGGSLFFALVAFLLGLLADKISPGLALLIFEVAKISVLGIYIKLYKNRE